MITIIEFFFFLSFIIRILGGELFERVIGDDFELTERACTVFMRQICDGVDFIHSNNIIHLDLKVISLQSYMFKMLKTNKKD